jgi:hypothetical protein
VSYGEEEDENSDELEFDDFMILQTAVRSPTQRAPTGALVVALSQIVVLEARAAAASSREDGMNVQGLPLRPRTPVNYAEDVHSKRWTLDLVLMGRSM